MTKVQESINALVGRNIRAARTKLGLSQDAFADECGIHRTYIGAIERGERNITLDTLERIARAAKITPIALLAPPRGGKS